LRLPGNSHQTQPDVGSKHRHPTQFFAAIAEIVMLLRDDPKTDWTQVDIKALRYHLVDMDNVTTQASVVRSIDELNVTFMVAGDESTAQSIQRMALAQGPMLQHSTGWIISEREQSNGATMEVQ
jgi:hypothetical protein